jgi:hypothetical protein
MFFFFVFFPRSLASHNGKINVERYALCVSVEAFYPPLVTVSAKSHLHQGGSLTCASLRIPDMPAKLWWRWFSDIQMLARETV